MTGPLLYHFADMPNESSIEMSYEELKCVIKKLNFEIIVSTRNVKHIFCTKINN